MRVKERRAKSVVFRTLRNAKPKEEWLFHLPIFRAVELPHCTSEYDLVMKRRIDGRWHYRRASAEGGADFGPREAW